MLYNVGFSCCVSGPCRVGLASMLGTRHSRSGLIGRRIALEARTHPGTWLHVEWLSPEVVYATGRILPRPMQVPLPSRTATCDV